MNIGISDERVDNLFHNFDVDGSGSIDASEFVRHLFPRAFHEMYGDREGQALPRQLSDITLAATSYERQHSPGPARSSMRLDAAESDNVTNSSIAQGPPNTQSS